MKRSQIHLFAFAAFMLALLHCSCATYKATTDCSNPGNDLLNEVLPIKPTLGYLGINPNASFPCQKPRANSYRIVSLFGGFWNIDPEITVLEDPQAPVTHIDLEKDWFEDLTSLLTLGAVNIMEVRFNDPRPDFFTPLHLDYVSGVPIGQSDEASLEYPGKESWLLFGLVPIDGGVLISNNDPNKEGLYIQKYEIDRSFLLSKKDPAVDKSPDVFVELGKILIFSPISTVADLLFVHSDWKYPLMIPGLGTFAPLRILWGSDSAPRKPIKPVNPSSKAAGPDGQSN